MKLIITNTVIKKTGDFVQKKKYLVSKLFDISTLFHAKSFACEPVSTGCRINTVT